MCRTVDLVLWWHEGGSEQLRESHPPQGLKSSDCRLGQGFPASALRAQIQQQQGGYLVMANIIHVPSYPPTPLRCSQTPCRNA